MDGGFPRRDEPLNVLGEPLAPCSDGDLVTGYYRDGSCATGPDESAPGSRRNFWSIPCGKATT